MPRGDWRPARACPCCENLIVLVILEGAKTVPIYMKSWDGDPIYNPSRHRKHAMKRKDRDYTAFERSEDA